MSESDGRLASETVPFITVQILAAALIAGPLVFAAVVFGIGWRQPPGDPTLAYVALGFSIMGLIASFAAPAIVTMQKLQALGRQGGDVSISAFFAVYQTRVIVRSALLEGTAFFCCIAYLAARDGIRAHCRHGPLLSHAGTLRRLDS